MKFKGASPLVYLLTLALLQSHSALAAQDKIDVHAFVNDACIVADEPYFVPPAPKGGDTEQMTPKFLPLLGLVIGKLAELFINHEIQSKAKEMKSGADRKDTRYASTSQMNLYRVDFQAAPVLHINGRLGCMTIVAAHLKPDPSDCTAAYLPKQLDPATLQLPQAQWKTSRTDDSVENQLRRANICVDGTAWAVYEARFEFSNDGTAYRLKNAGYRINSLLTTQDKGASRSAVYTLKISQPAATDQLEVLSSAWVKLGTVTAGSRSGESADDDAAPWWRVPPMTVEARRAYDEKTGTRQQLSSEIDALKRALVRNQRVIDGLDRRIDSASSDLVDGLKQERTKTAVQVQVQEAELDARNSELQEMPHDPLEFMPVQIEVSVTETESEKKTQLALADIVGGTGGAVASAVGTELTTMISRSMKLPADGDSAALGSAAESKELARARARYFDALVDSRADTRGAPTPELQSNLSAAKTRYNDARHSLGLDPIP